MKVDGESPYLGGRLSGDLTAGYIVDRSTAQRQLQLEHVGFLVGLVYYLDSERRAR